MNKTFKIFISAMLLGIPATSFAQRPARTSQYIKASVYSAIPVTYRVNTDISLLSTPASPVMWGMDTAWDSEDNVIRGTNYISKAVMKIGRVSFQATDIVGEDFVLSSAQQAALQRRLNHIALSGIKDITLNHDNGQWSDPEKGPTYKANYYGKPVNWYRVIKASVLYARQKGFNVVTISPFNEPDYKGWGDAKTGVKDGWTDQGTVAHFKEVAKLLTEDTDLAGIRISAGNTLNCDEALTWYNGVKPYATEGNTHQLAGSFDTYAKFWQTVRNNGHIATADELHNTMEAFVGIHYGLQQGIWWGWDGASRGEFCKASYYGKEVGYAENRSTWTAASVYKWQDPKRIMSQGKQVAAFLGCSERQANPQTYEIASLDRPVYYDSYGPVYGYPMFLPAGTGYNVGQYNAERMVQVNYGEDVPFEPIYTDRSNVIENKACNYCFSASNAADGTTITKGSYTGTASNNYQRWIFEPIANNSGGDFGYYIIRSERNKSQVIDLKDWSTAAGANIITWVGGGGTNEQWFFEYAGDGYYYIRSRHSGLYLGVTGTSALGAVVTQTFTGDDKQKWRFIPTNASLEKNAPTAPTGLETDMQSASIRLSWTASTASDVVSYMIYRAKEINSEETIDATSWDVVGRMVEGTEFIDNDVKDGEMYRYYVKAIDKSRNLSVASTPISVKTALIPETLVAQYSFENNLEDATQNILDAVDVAASYSTSVKKVGESSLTLNGTTAHLSLPAGVVCSKEMTIATWVYSTSSSNWQRIFDFGNGQEQYMFLTPTNGSQMRFVMKNGGEEEILSTTTLGRNAWHHVAVTIGNTEVALYVDGKVVASSTSMTIRPMDINPVRNYIGRSQFVSDPRFKGNIDDFRIYNCALSAENIAKIYNGEDPTDINIPMVQERKSEEENKVFDISGKRLLFPQKGINIINGKKINY